MGTYVFKLPDIGEGITESEIAAWRVKIGDVVKQEQPLVDMLTEKAAVELPSPVAGRVLSLNGTAGDKIAVGSALVTLEVEGAGTTPQQVEVKPAPPAATTRLAPSDSLKPSAAPSVRKRARELGVDLHAVTGSGPSGRVVREDLERHTGVSPATAAVRAPALAVEEIKIIGLRRKIADAMQRSKQRIPHFAYVEEVDVTELESLRQQLNSDKSGRPKLTLLPFLMRALVRAVPKFPNVNATFDDEAGVLRRSAALHVGIAAQTPNGLIVPVVRHAETLDLWQSAGEIARLAEAARSGKAKREELSGSTITISSLGRMGGIVSTPIINAPEVAIVGVNKLVERPMVRNGQIVVRTMMNLSSSFDHRIVDGWDAASFIQELKKLLETPGLLFV